MTSSKTPTLLKFWHDISLCSLKVLVAKNIATTHWHSNVDDLYYWCALNSYNLMRCSHWLVYVVLKVCDNCHGGSGLSAGVLPCTVSQSLRWELPQDGTETAGVWRTRPAMSGHIFCEFDETKCNSYTNGNLKMCHRCYAANQWFFFQVTDISFIYQCL